jgi:hypothetical protein
MRLPRRRAEKLGDFGEAEEVLLLLGQGVSSTLTELPRTGSALLWPRGTDESADR